MKKDNICECCGKREKAPGFRFLCFLCWKTNGEIVDDDDFGEDSPLDELTYNADIDLY